MAAPQPNRAFAWTQAPWGPALECAALGPIAPHLFTIGNLRLEPQSSEWSMVATAIGVRPDRIRLIRQVHGAAVAAARGNGGQPWSPPEADAIASDDSSVAIAVRVADCAPILLADRTGVVVAAVHAGWRGTMQRVVQTAVDRLAEQFGSPPSELVAAIGPCLGPCCGEVGPEVPAAFRAAGHGAESLDGWFSPGPSGRAHLDLWRANRDQLEACGVPATQIHVAELCTKTHAAWMHSYRAHGAGAGRMVGIIRARSDERASGCYQEGCAAPAAGTGGTK